MIDNMIAAFINWLTCPAPNLGETRTNRIFIILPMTLNGEKRGWGWHDVEEEAQEEVLFTDNGAIDHIKFTPVRWADEQN